MSEAIDAVLLKGLSSNNTVLNVSSAVDFLELSEQGNVYRQLEQLPALSLSLICAIVIAAAYTILSISARPLLDKYGNRAPDGPRGLPILGLRRRTIQPTRNC